MPLFPESLLDASVTEAGHDLLTKATYDFPPHKICKAVTGRLSAFLVREFDYLMRFVLRSERRIGGVEG